MFLNIDDVAERVRRPYHSMRGSIPVTLLRQGAETTSALSSDIKSADGMHVVPEQRIAARPAPTRVVSTTRRRRVPARIRAWMVVIPVDAALLLAPIWWTPELVKAFLSMAALSLFLLSDGRRYRARLHLSVLDELPTLIARLLTAAAVVATVIALRHDQGSVTTFLSDVIVSVGLVVLGRILTTRLIRWSREHRTTVHRTVIIGGGPLAAELAQILLAHPRYGLAPIGYVDDENGIAQAVIPRIGGLDDLDRCVAHEQVDVLLVTDGGFSERRLLDIVRTPHAGRCDLLVVPRMHHFATQTGAGDHIGSIPVMRIRTPNLQGVACAVKRAFDIVVAGLVLVLTAPLVAICAVLVRVEGGRGVIFRQARVGRHGVVFDCLKLRSMRP